MANKWDPYAPRIEEIADSTIGDLRVVPQKAPESKDARHRLSSPSASLFIEPQIERNVDICVSDNTIPNRVKGVAC